jgi:23S rRNA pseudouridine2605 synthase
LKPGEGTRLNRWLAECGICSRREADELIRSGKVRVNGEPCLDLSRRIGPGDRVSCQGQELRRITEKVYLMLNKPRGYVVTHSDELQRETIYSLLPDSAANLRYAGRLDKNSEGLLLMTNDGELINALTHPKRKVEKVYRVEINRRLSRKELEDLRHGVQIEGGVTLPAGVFVKNDGGQGMTLKMVITEGRKRQIRRMFSAVGNKVLTLHRRRFGMLTDAGLALGQARPLSPQEVERLRRAAEEGPGALTH